MIMLKTTAYDMVKAAEEIAVWRARRSISRRLEELAEAWDTAEVADSMHGVIGDIRSLAYEIYPGEE